MDKIQQIDDEIQSHEDRETEKGEKQYLGEKGEKGDKQYFIF